ncbi:hypothetical protein PoB_001013900 [Plakobranchus ocellatus]|uniref:Uncharacterized protein n=1 Tax=Plakobranchus ocellatus TaxID=259542 RepID=A0AAV3YNN5_9GAST|nr:hypothetical protein PoB_001013900 [Plakobranchus ocellatus]
MPLDLNGPPCDENGQSPLSSPPPPFPEPHNELNMGNCGWSSSSASPYLSSYSPSPPPPRPLPPLPPKTPTPSPPPLPFHCLLHPPPQLPHETRPQHRTPPASPPGLDIASSPSSPPPEFLSPLRLMHDDDDNNGDVVSSSSSSRSPSPLASSPPYSPDDDFYYDPDSIVPFSPIPMDASDINNHHRPEPDTPNPPYDPDYARVVHQYSFASRLNILKRWRYYYPNARQFPPESAMDLPPSLTSNGVRPIDLVVPSLLRHVLTHPNPDPSHRMCPVYHPNPEYVQTRLEERLDLDDAIHTRLEERLDLDDAIHVLRNHAEGQPLLPPGHPGLPPPPMMAAAGHPAHGVMGGAFPPHHPAMIVGGPPHMDGAHLVSTFELKHACFLCVTTVVRGNMWTIGIPIWFVSAAVEAVCSSRRSLDCDHVSLLVASEEVTDCPGLSGSQFERNDPPFK